MEHIAYIGPCFKVEAGLKAPDRTKGETAVRESDWQHFKVRLSPDMHERLKVAAAQNRRSMSQEIMVRLEATFGNDAIDGEWQYAHMRMEPSRPVPAPEARPEPSTDPRLERALTLLEDRLARLEMRLEASESARDTETVRKPARPSPAKPRK